MVLGLKKSLPKRKMQSLTEVHTSMGFVEAEVIKSYLESSGIKCVFKGTGAQSIMPQTTNGMGQIKIYVMDEDVELAEELLKKLNPEE